MVRSTLAEELGDWRRFREPLWVVTLAYWDAGSCAGEGVEAGAGVDAAGWPEKVRKEVIT